MNKRYAILNLENRLVHAFIEVEETKAKEQELAQQALYPGTAFVEVDPLTPTAVYWFSLQGVMVQADE